MLKKKGKDLFSLKDNFIKRASDQENIKLKFSYQKSKDVNIEKSSENINPNIYFRTSTYQVDTPKGEFQGAHNPFENDALSYKLKNTKVDGNNPILASLGISILYSKYKGFLENYGKDKSIIAQEAKHEGYMTERNGLSTRFDYERKQQTPVSKDINNTGKKMNLKDKLQQVNYEKY